MALSPGLPYLALISSANLTMDLCMKNLPLLSERGKETRKSIDLLPRISTVHPADDPFVPPTPSHIRVPRR
jgi:hypothetical protein